MNAHVDEFRKALRIVKSSPDVRAARIAALRAQIAAGTYRPDPQEIARRIIQQGL
jgi:flagellar biosynthesis anti-sigma factor FlgM